MTNRDKSISYVPFGIILLTPLAALILLSVNKTAVALMLGILLLLFRKRIPPLVSPASTTGSLISSRLFIAVFSGLVVIYLWLITAGGRSLFGTDILGQLPDALGRSFLDGRADVSISILQAEAWILNGKHFTYLGPFPALLRIVLNALAPEFSGRWSRLSCLFAGSLTLWAIASLFKGNLDHLKMGGRQKRNLLCGLLIGSALGTPLFFLMSTACYYHEVILWGLCGSMWTLAIFLDKDLQTRRPLLSLCLISSFAGIALLSRMTFGTPCLVVAALSALRCLPRSRPETPYWKWGLALTPILAALGFQALYNHARFGTIWSVYPIKALITYQHTAPEWMPADLFDWRRVPTALRNYFGFLTDCYRASFPFIEAPTGMDFNAATQLPEVNFSLANGSPWLIVAAIAGFWALLQSNPRESGSSLPMLQKDETVHLYLIFYALLAECWLILSFTYEIWRYQAEFLPLLFFLAAVFLRSSDWESASKMKRSVLAGAFFLLISISAASTVGATLDLASSYYEVPVDFRIELHRIFDAINSRLLNRPI